MTHSKICFKCKVEKPLTEFYRHVEMADGHLNKCKDCTRSDVSTNRLKNIDKIREYDRDRAKNPERAKAAAEISKAWRQSDKRITAAHNAVTRSIRKGEMQRLPCVRCGSQKSVAHHENYNRPLDVMWLCQPCHKQRHKEIALAEIDQFA